MSTVNEGKVYLCPNCGANLGAFESTCPECGHEIRDNVASNSVRSFADKYMNASDTALQAKIVEAFPVPNNKEDLLEFMSMAGPQAGHYRKLNNWMKMLLLTGVLCIIGLSVALATAIVADDPSLGYFGAGFIIVMGILIGLGSMMDSDKDKSKVTSAEKTLANAWASKMEQVTNKARLLAVSDPTFIKKMELVSGDYTKKKRNTIKLIGAVWGVVICLTIALCISASHSASAQNDKETQINELIEQGCYDEAAALQLEMLPDGKKKASNAYFQFLAKCVQKMVNDGEYDEARSFVESHILYFEEKSFLTAGIDRETAEERLNNIINN
ncbi:MAG: zinc ribbon domain-containing protein [Muribaculum sp.]|nr:zinc ribbon domain-containing protein [Muribaculum sp.]